MTDENPTPEQIAAVEWLRRVSLRGKLIVSDSSLDAYADAILAALPTEWTEWRPALPKKPGHYADRDDFVWTLSADGEWSGDPDHIGQFLPLTRLVPAVEFVDVNA